MTQKISSKNSFLTKLIWAILVLTLFAIFAKGILAPRGQSVQNETNALPLLGEIAPLVLAQQNGSSFDLSGLRGKIWVADFIFTHCAGPCPLMTAQMSQLAKKFREETDVQFISFSVDPERDTPEVLSKYAARYEADPETWRFLTADKKTLYSFIQKQFRLGVTDITPSEREAVDQTISHSTKFVLVDRSLRLRGFYETLDQGQVERLVKDILTLLKE